MSLALTVSAVYLVVDRWRLHWICTLWKEEEEEEEELCVFAVAGKDYRPRDCVDICLIYGHEKTDVYSIYLGKEKKDKSVLCDMHTDGGGWTVCRRLCLRNNICTGWVLKIAHFYTLQRCFIDY